MRRRTTAGIAAALLAAAACLAASAAWADGLMISGTRHEGGAVNSFVRLVDLANGHEISQVIHGPSTEQDGFDGSFWNFVNGAANTIDLPSVVADRRAEMWVRQAGFLTLAKPGELNRRVAVPGASAIDLAFDPRSRRVTTATIHGDYGPMTVSFGDWRRVGTFDYPFRETTMTDEGEQVDLARSVAVLRTVDAKFLQRPREPVGGHLSERAVTVPFTPTGRAKTHALVAATLNGAPVDFVFDTGGANVLTTDAARRFSIAASGGINVGGVGEGSEQGGFGLIERIALGGASLTNQSFIIVPSFFPPENGKPSEVAGLLGYEFLAHFVTTLDYRAQSMTFRDKVPADQRGIRVPFFSDGHGIAVSALINGKPGLVGFDTGDGGTLTLFPAFSAAHRLDDGKGEAAATSGGVGGAVKARSGALDHFVLAGVDFPGLPVKFSQNSSGAFASRYLAGNLGGSVLRCFRITFDFPHHQLWLEPQLDTPRCAASTGRGQAAASPGRG